MKDIESFEILAVTMHQTDFSKLHEMNVRSNIVLANQCDRTAYEECELDGHTAKMIFTETRGVGINRNIALMYASADICLFADDDVTYVGDMEERVLSEFKAHPDADIIIFNLDTDSERKQIKYTKTKKCGCFTRMPWGAVRIAFRLDSVRKANLWFTSFFGGGCVFPSGEDSMWLAEAKRRGLTFYVSKESLGKISMESSSWFSGYNESFFYGKGAYCACVHPHTFFIWSRYYALRYRGKGNLKLRDKLSWIKNGKAGFKQSVSYDDFLKG